jgi:hypothetical protein
MSDARGMAVYGGRRRALFPREPGKSASVRPQSGEDDSEWYTVNLGSSQGWKMTSSIEFSATNAFFPPPLSPPPPQLPSPLLSPHRYRLRTRRRRSRPNLRRRRRQNRRTPSCPSGSSREGRSRQDVGGTTDDSESVCGFEEGVGGDE